MGKTSTHSIVLASLEVGGKNCGMQAFMVQLRNLQNHLPLPGKNFLMLKTMLLCSTLIINKYNGLLIDWTNLTKLQHVQKNVACSILWK